MKSFNVLDQDEAIKGKYVLEASAGTGKTFAIEHLATRLIITEESPCSLNQMLVVTFTKAAARELKTRIRNTIAKYLESEGLSIRAERRLREALICFDQAQIFTIHGFCHKILSEYAYEANWNYSESDNERQQLRLLYKQSVTDTLRLKFKEPFYHPLQIEKLSGKFRHDANQLIEAAVDQLEKNNKVKPIYNYRQILDEFKKIADSLKKIKGNLLSDDFAKYCAAYKRISGGVSKAQFENFLKLINGEMTHTEFFDQILKDGELFWDWIDPENMKKNGKPILHDSLFYPELIKQLKKEVGPLYEMTENSKSILDRFVQDCRENAKQLLEKQGKYGPDLLLSSMQKALDQPHFITLIQNRYRAVFIDEFQDTDPIQWDIFKRLFLNTDSDNRFEAIYLIGDPKQSIYAFRQADLNVYLSAVNQIGENNCRSLQVNYRSDPALIESLNAFFSKKEWFGFEGIHYVPVFSRPNLENRLFQDDKGALHFYTFFPNQEKKLFSTIGSEMIVMKQKEKINFSEMAVLVRDRYQGMEIAETLRQMGIPSILKQSEALVDSKGYLLMRDLLKAVAYPQDPSAIKSLFASALFNWQHTDLYPNNTDRVAADDSLEFASLVCNENIGGILEKIFHHRWGKNKKTILENLAANPDRFLYSEWMQCVELIMEKESRETLHPLSLLRFWNQIDRDHKKKIEPLGDEVPIMTIHASKGLEFAIVFALGLGKEIDNKEDPEEMRLLYVAMTRAKHRLYLPLSSDGQIDILKKFLNKIDLPDEKALSGFIFKNPHLSISMASSEEKEMVYIQDEKVPTLIPPFSISKATNQRFIASYSSLTQKKSGELLQVNQKEEPLIPAGAGTGILIHALIEKFFSKKIGIENLSSFVFEELEHTSLGPFCKEVDSMLKSAFNHPFLNGKCLTDVNPDRVFTEMEFLYPSPEGYIKGFIDLIIEFEDKYYVIDWKTNWLGNQIEDYSEDKLKKQMEQHNYFLQAEIYMEALKRMTAIFEKEIRIGGCVYFFLRGPAVYLHSEISK